MGCASAIEANLRGLPTRAQPAALALALRCLALPVEERAPILAVLKQMGVRPEDIAGSKYRRFEVRPRGSHIECGDLGLLSIEASLGSKQPTFATWREVVAHAVKHKAALRSEQPDLTGRYDTRFEHLLGLPQAPMVWSGAPLQLDITEVRPNVVVCALHCGDFKPLAPEVMRSVLYTRDTFGAIVVAASGHLVISRRVTCWASTNAFNLRGALGRLAAHGLITHAMGDAFAAAMPWGDTRDQKPPDDLAFALETLGTHAASSFPHHESYQTMWRLAPALLAVGGHFERNGIADSPFTPWRWQRLQPWSDLLANTPLHEIVRGFAP